MSLNFGSTIKTWAKLTKAYTVGAIHIYSSSVALETNKPRILIGTNGVSVGKSDRGGSEPVIDHLQVGCSRKWTIESQLKASETIKP